MLVAGMGEQENKRRVLGLGWGGMQIIEWVKRMGKWDMEKREGLGRGKVGRGKTDTDVIGNWVNTTGWGLEDGVLERNDDVDENGKNSEERFGVIRIFGISRNETGRDKFTRGESMGKVT